mgnify:CR=1 FL=1
MSIHTEVGVGSSVWERLLRLPASVRLGWARASAGQALPLPQTEGGGMAGPSTPRTSLARAVAGAARGGLT